MESTASKPMPNLCRIIYDMTCRILCRVQHINQNLPNLNDLESALLSSLIVELISMNEQFDV
jgi:hypothetical protein